jgi:hypothetical protein
VWFFKRLTQLISKQEGELLYELIKGGAELLRGNVEVL